MSEKIYYITDDSCFPLDPDAISVESMDRDEFEKHYDSDNWTFESEEEAKQYMRERFED